MQKTFEEIFETLPSKGWLTRAEARLLWDEARLTRGKILEVGCYHGRSTCLLAALGRQVVVVDNFAGFDDGDVHGDETCSNFLRNVKERGLLPCVSLLKFRLAEVNLNGHEFGMCYLDGDHSYQGTLEQIDKALACRPQTVAVHDVNDDGGGLEVRRACLERLGPWRERVERLAVWRLRQLPYGLKEVWTDAVADGGKFADDHKHLGGPHIGGA